MLTWLQRLLVVACGLKAIDCADRASLALAVAWLLAGLLIHRCPHAGAMTVPLVLASLEEGIRNEHMWLYGYVGVLLALLAVGWVNEPTARLAAMAQVSIVYGFAGFSKINPDWLSGARAEQTMNVPLGRIAGLVAAVVVVYELGLAVAVWLAPRVLWVGGVALHAGMVVLVSNDLMGAVRLSCFAVVLFALYPLRVGVAVQGSDPRRIARVRRDLVPEHLRSR